MIGEKALWVECDGCRDRIWFDFSFVLKHDDSWQTDERFAGWWIDWQGSSGRALCPKCSKERAE